MINIILFDNGREKHLYENVDFSVYIFLSDWDLQVRWFSTNRFEIL